MARFTSRKFLMAVAGLVIALATYLQGQPGMERYAMILGALIVAATYIYAEGQVDAASAGAATSLPDVESITGNVILPPANGETTTTSTPRE